MTPSGAVTEFTAGVIGDAYGVTDGALTATFGSRPPRTAWAGSRRRGLVTYFGAGTTPNSQVRDIAGGPDGNLWFTKQFAGSDPDVIGRITPI